jgi:chromosome segregation ATPase
MPKGGAKGSAAEKSTLVKEEERLATMLALYAGEDSIPDTFKETVVQQQRLVDQLRQEEEERRSPAEKVSALRKELGAATDALADTIINDQALCEQMRALEEQQELNREEAYRYKEQADELREKLREQEFKCDLKAQKKTGEQVDMSAEAQAQRDSAKLSSTVQSCSKAKGIEIPEANLAPLRETLGIA